MKLLTAKSEPPTTAEIFATTGAILATTELIFEKALAMAVPIFVRTEPMDVNAELTIEPIVEKIDPNPPEVSASAIFLIILETTSFATGAITARKRIYSLSGRDRRFPKIPDDFASDCCGLSLYPYIWGVSEPSFSAKDPIKYSNRPFVDDRTSKQKKDYQEIMKEAENQRQKEQDRKIYEILLLKLPNDAPKSFGAFRRMKSGNSAGYIVLKEKASNYGIKI